MTQRQNIQRHRNKFIKREPTKRNHVKSFTSWESTSEINKLIIEKNMPLDVYLMTVIEFKLVCE